MNRLTQIILGVVVLVVVAGASFYGGMLFANSQRAQNAVRFAGGQGGFLVTRGGGPNGQGGGLFGQITEIGSGYMVISDNSGKQTRIQVTDTTLIEKNASVQLSDLATGETVLVSGNAGSDGTYTARSIQVAPAGRFGAPGGANAPVGNPRGNNPGDNAPGGNNP